jgi:hypothetical protein
MIIGLIAVISLVALAQFGVFYWRAAIAVTAATPVSDRLRHAAGIGNQTLTAADFRSLLPLVEICPPLVSDGAGIGGVRVYYALMSAVSRLLGPAMAGWAVAEMATCTRYLAARLDQRIASNSTLWNSTAG